MKVRFLKPDLNTLPKVLDLGYSTHANFNMRIDRTYIVYGVSMWRSVLHYLVIPDNASLPSWYPADIFVVTDERVPPNWHFRHRTDDDPSKIKFELGYKEMVQDDMHSDALIEREVDAIRVFLARKEEIETAILD